MPFCARCGQRVPAGANFCTACGQEVVGTIPPPSGTGPTEQGRPPVVIDNEALAPIGRRLVSWLIDGAVVCAFFLGTSMLATATAPEATYSNPSPQPGGVGTLLLALGWLAAFAYPVYFEGAEAGQTPGMRAVGIRVIRERDARPLGFKTASGRLLGLIANLWGIGLLVALRDPRRRTLRDQVSGTLMVRASGYPSESWPGAGSWSGEEFRPVGVFQPPPSMMPGLQPGT